MKVKRLDVRMLKLGLKLLLTPVWLIAIVMHLWAKLLIHMSEVAGGMLMMIYFVCFVITVCRQDWIQTLLVLAGAGMTVLLIFAAASVIWLFENFATAIGDFMIS